MQSGRLKQGTIRITAAILLLCFMFSLAGTYVVYKTQRHFVKREMKSAINEGKFGDIAETYAFVNLVAKNKFKWIESGKEFELNDSKYDVVELYFHNGVLMMKCINDVLEKKLEKNFSLFFKDEFDKTKSGVKTKTILSLYVNHGIENVFEVFICDKSEDYHFYCSLTSQYSPGLITPPPNFKA